MNDVPGFETKRHRHSDGNVNFVGGGEDAARVNVVIPNFPPPLMSREFDYDTILAGKFGCKSTPNDKTVNKKHEQNHYRRDY